jgi:hypothetical protein
MFSSKKKDISIFVNVTMYPQYNNNMITKKNQNAAKEKKWFKEYFVTCDTYVKFQFQCLYMKSAGSAVTPCFHKAVTATEAIVVTEADQPTKSSI